MSENPWVLLPAAPPYVLPQDKADVDSFNERRGREHAHFLHTDTLLPEPFVGAKRAPVLLLSNNPGFGEKEERIGARQDAAFRERMRKNLAHELREPSDYPFLYLHPEFNGPGKKWWKSKLKDLLKKFGDEIVARSVMNVVYFPYASRKFGHLELSIPSREYGFGLVREAVGSEKVIVLMRPGKADAWREAVPGLVGYDRFFMVNNPQNPAISRKNCREYQQVEDAIAAFAGS